MKRTQVYLTEEERKALRSLARESGKTFSATLREAVDEYIARNRGGGLPEAIRASHGCRRDRHQEPDLRRLRREWSER